MDQFWFGVVRLDQHLIPPLFNVVYGSGKLLLRRQLWIELAKCGRVQFRVNRCWCAGVQFGISLDLGRCSETGVGCVGTLEVVMGFVAHSKISVVVVLKDFGGCGMHWGGRDVTHGVSVVGANRGMKKGIVTTGISSIGVWILVHITGGDG